MQLKSRKFQGWMAYEKKYINPSFDVLRGLLLACFNQSYKNGRLSDTQQEGLISLLLKIQSTNQS